MGIFAAALQMASTVGRVGENLDRADALLDRARKAGAELAVLPEMFNTGYGLIPDYAPLAESRTGRTIAHLSARARKWKVAVAAGFVEREGDHLYDSLAYCDPDGSIHVYRKRNLVFWENTKFRRGRGPLVVRTRFGRIGFAICADMIFRGIWREYRGAIDLAIVGAAWPDFACRTTGRKHWLLGRVGPLAAEIPGLVANDLEIPVIFANQTGPTRTTIPVLGTAIDDHFAGRSAVCPGPGEASTGLVTGEGIALAEISPHPSRKGRVPWRSTSRSARAA